MFLRASSSLMGIGMSAGSSDGLIGFGKAHSLTVALVISRPAYAYGVGQSEWVKTRTELCPPKPKELLIATRTC